MDWIKNFFLGTERVKASKADCKTKKEKAKTDYDAVMKQIEAECEESLKKAKEADKAVEPTAPVVAPEPKNTGYFSSSNDNPPSAQQPNRMGGKSKKRPKSNRKKTKRKH